MKINLRHVEQLLRITSIDVVHRFTGDKTLLCTLLSCMLESDGGSKGRKKLKYFPPELRKGEEIARSSEDIVRTNLWSETFISTS